jgi:hypothetical protein
MQEAIALHVDGMLADGFELPDQLCDDGGGRSLNRVMPPRHPFTPLFAAILGAGCAHLTPPTTNPHQEIHLVATDTTQRGWSASDSAALALGLPALRYAAPDLGVREMRIWTEFAIGEPHDLLRLVRRCVATFRRPASSLRPECR